MRIAEMDHETNTLLREVREHNAAQNNLLFSRNIKDGLTAIGKGIEMAGVCISCGIVVGLFFIACNLK
jgi:hypothetical protein